MTGRVTKILPAQWATPDNQRPGDPATAVEGAPLHGIITPVIVTLDSPPIVNHVGADFSSGRIVIVQPGGQVGQDSISYRGLPTFKLGEHVILILDRGATKDGARTLTSTDAGPAWDVTAKYVLTDNGDAIVNGKTQSAKALISELREAGGTPTP